MPRVRRRTTIHVDAAGGGVVAAARRELHLDDDLTGITSGDAAIAVTVSEEDPTHTLVEVVVTDDLSVPFFQWFFALPHRWSLTRAARHAAETIKAAATGGTVPDPLRRSLFLPPTS